MSDLPEDILLDIIARAPVKTIVICKCVSKTWFNLLSLPSFAKLQFRKSICNKKLLTVASSSTTSPHWEEEIYQFDHEEDVCLQQFLHPPRIDYNYNWTLPTLGSCNGLLLLSDRADKLLVYNPILKESVELLPAKSLTCSHRTCFGIGYSHVSDTYKVVQFQRDQQARVCVLRGGGRETIISWRDIVPNSHYEDGYDIKQASYYAHGALHWWRIQHLDFYGMGGATISYSIVCFDIETEQFGLLSPPQFLRRFRFLDYFYVYAHLGVLGGCLAVICNCNFEFSIWVMKRYGVEESWTKEIILEVQPSDFSFCPLLMLKNGNVLFPGVGTYDPKEKTMKKGRVFPYLSGDVPYVPSLLSPKDL